MCVYIYLFIYLLILFNRLYSFINTKVFNIHIHSLLVSVSKGLGSREGFRVVLQVFCSLYE